MKDMHLIFGRLTNTKPRSELMGIGFHLNQLTSQHLIEESSLSGVRRKNLKSHIQNLKFPREQRFG